MIEEFIVSKTGEARLVDAYHRFVYGFTDSTPDLWLKDNAADAGAVPSSGNVSDSPDVSIRNIGDDVPTHQSPKAGQDNWFYARIRNKGTSEARHFVVTFNFRTGTNFVYPADFVPCLSAKADFNLPPGQETIVKARWARVDVPPAPTSGSVLVSIIAKEDQPTAGSPVQGHNNLAQKEVTVVN
jgi:hypothetical protein